MKQETLEIEEKKYTINELKYKDVAALQELSKTEAAKKMMQLSTGITDEEYDELGMSDGVALMKLANKVNNLDTENFQQPIQA